jgi:hypothetical protein
MLFVFFVTVFFYVSRNVKIENFCLDLISIICNSYVLVVVLLLLILFPLVSLQLEIRSQELGQKQIL